jgi:metallo-beta-lactamase class B
MRRLLVLVLLGAGCAPAEPWHASIDWNAPFPAHRVIDNVYFVGTAMLGTFLITTPDGHILINSDFESSVPSIRRGVEQLGFRFDDIEIVLGSHAHADHMEADALVQELTGARVMALAEDVPLLRSMRPGGKPHPIDRVLSDGDRVELGDTVLTAYRTPGHTPGCTSWGMEVEEEGRRYHALIVCSFGVNPDYVLVNNAAYPEIARDYQATFARARQLPVDVFLGSHGFFYGLEAKHAALVKRRAGDPNPFVDPAGYLAHVDAQERVFREKLAAQEAAAR